MKSFFLGALLLASPALADETAIKLKPGPGAETTAAFCAACHSLDYIQMNSVFQTPESWKAEVAKMRAVFHAPIEQPDADQILDYLVKNYGAPPKS